jgi:hypothetical protein
MAYNPSAFEARRRGLVENYGATGAMNAYSNFLSKQRGNRDLVTLNQNFDKQAPQMVAGYGRRNLVSPNIRSGAFAKAMQDFAKNRVQQISELQRSLDEQNYGFGLQENQARTQFNSSLAELEADKAQQIQDDAQNILKYRAGSYA